MRYNEKDSCTFLEKLEYINGSTVIKIPSRNNYVININTNIFQVTKDDPFYGSLGWETNIKNASFENNYWHIELKENLPNLEEYFSNQMLYNEYQSLSTRNDFEDFFSIHSCQELLVNYCLGYIKNNNRIIKIIVDKVVDKNIIAIKADYFGGQIIDLRDKEIVLYKRNEMVFSRENVLNGFSQDRIMYEDNGLQLVPIRPNNIFLHEGNTNIVYINKILPQSDIYDESNIVAGYKIYTDKIANIYAEVTDPASGKRVRSNTIKILVSLPEYLKGESGFKLKEEEFGKESGIGGSNFLTVNEIEAQNEYNNAVDEIITINILIS